MKIYVAGDVHGNPVNMAKHIYRAGERKISHLIVCGDFGLWTHFADGQTYLDEIQEAARINNLNVYAVGGNHENWDHWNWMVENFPNTKGFARARSRILLAPKAHKWKWDGKVFVAAGGAVSVDKDMRLKEERGYDFHYDRWVKSKATGPRTLWWPNEEFTDNDIKTIASYQVEADYLFTHDCSNNTPFGRRLKPDLDSEIHRKRIDKVIHLTRPLMHFHGHMHEKYDWVNSIRVPTDDRYPEGWHDIQTYGLEADAMLNSWGVLDTQTDEFLWQGGDADEYFQAWEDGLHGAVEGVLDAPETTSLIAKIKRVAAEME